MFLGVGVLQQDISSDTDRRWKRREHPASTEPLKTRLDDLLKLASDRDFIWKKQKISMQRSANIHLHFGRYPSWRRNRTFHEYGELLDMQISNVGLGTEFGGFVSCGRKYRDPLPAGLPDQTLRAGKWADPVSAWWIERHRCSRREWASRLPPMQKWRIWTVCSTSPVLYRTQDTMQFTGTYASLKDMVDYLADQTGRMTLDNVMPPLIPQQEIFQVVLQ